GGSESGYSISYVNDKLRFLIKTASMGNNDWNSNPGYAISVGSWQHIAGTYDGSTIKYYVDADQKETRSATGNINWKFSPQGFYIGKFHDDSEDNYYNGKIDEVRISDVARSADWLWADQQTMASNNSFTSYVIPEP
ncbi:LamG domain-containing protein, partial [bacterium]|nr:LamG domain-containing protein [bacterium]